MPSRGACRCSGTEANSWKFRVSPDQLGVWKWSVKSRDAGLNGKSGSFEAVASRRPGSIRPMKGFPQHFERQDGKPFWFLGDTAWALYTDSAEEKHDRAAALRYIDVRAGQGVNVLHSMLLSEAGWGNQGGKPWEDLAAEKLNPGYWQEVDFRLAHANAKGVVCGLALAWGDKRKQEPFAWRMFPECGSAKAVRPLHRRAVQRLRRLFHRLGRVARRSPHAAEHRRGRAAGVHRDRRRARRMPIRTSG